MTIIQKNTISQYSKINASDVITDSDYLYSIKDTTVTEGGNSYKVSTKETISRATLPSGSGNIAGDSGYNFSSSEQTKTFVAGPSAEGYDFSSWSTSAGTITSASEVLTNLIPATASGFENNGWSTGTYSTDYKHSGSYSLALTGTTTVPEITSQLSTSIAQVQNHIYYSRIYEYHTDSALNGSTWQIYWPIAEPSMCSVSFGAANQWNMLSCRNTRSDWSSGAKDLRIDFDNRNLAGTVYYDDFMLIDLTAAFGSGNEPSQDWCDAHIPYFVESAYIGTLTIPANTTSAITVTGVFEKYAMLDAHRLNDVSITSVSFDW